MQTRTTGGLSETSAISVGELGRALAAGKAPPTLLKSVLDDLGALRPEAVGSVDRQLAPLGGLWAYHYGQLSPLGGPRRAADIALLRRRPELAPIFLFHSDGFVREAALDTLEEPPGTSFFFAAIVWRLNDWSGEVRAAAARAAERLFPATHAEIIAGARSVLLGRTSSWGRWRQEQQAVVDRILERADVVAQLARCFALEISGPLGKELKQALRESGFDQHLQTLSRTAGHPQVRAVALEALIRGRASWRTGFRKEWIDKTYGIVRLVPVYSERSLAERIPVHELIVQGLGDKFASVRRLAADAMIEHRSTFPGLTEAMERLGRDKSRSVRERAEFLRRTLAQEA